MAAVNSTSSRIYAEGTSKGQLRSKNPPKQPYSLFMTPLGLYSRLCQMFHHYRMSIGLDGLKLQIILVDLWLECDMDL